MDIVYTNSKKCFTSEAILSTASGIRDDSIVH